jgi:transcriptional regulator with XRE-family HTH domain
LASTGIAYDLTRPKDEKGSSEQELSHAKGEKMRHRYISESIQNRITGEIAFSRNLRKLISEGRLSLNQISEISGVAKSVAHGWVNGVVPRDLLAVAKLSDALDMQFRELLLGESEASDKAKGATKTKLSEKELFDQFCGILINRLENKK